MLYSPIEWRRQMVSIDERAKRAPDGHQHAIDTRLHAKLVDQVVENDRAGHGPINRRRLLLARLTLGKQRQTARRAD